MYQDPSSSNENGVDIQRTIHYVLSQAEAVHLPPLDIETIKQVLLTKLMVNNLASNSALGGDTTSSMYADNNEDVALLAAQRVSAEAAMKQQAMQNGDALTAEEECQNLCDIILEKLNNHKRATLRAISAARSYDTAWANLVPALRRFEVNLPLNDIQSPEGKMTITEHISRCVLAMRALAVWQASAIHLVEAIILWRSGLNRPFPFALDGHCNLLLRIALDSAAIKSSPIPHPLLIGGAGVNLDQVVIPIFFSHLPSLCEFALVSSSQDSFLESNALHPQSLFGFGGGNVTYNNVANAHNLHQQQNNNNSSFDDSATSHSVAASVSGEDELVKSLARRWERRVIGMHFASKHDAVQWALEAAEDVVASFASLPGRRGQVQETYQKRLRSAEFTISLEHNTHWQLMKELLSLCANESKHIPLLHLPGVLEPRGGEDGIVLECPQLLETLFRTVVSAIETLNGLTQLPTDGDEEEDQGQQQQDQQHQYIEECQGQPEQQQQQEENNNRNVAVVRPTSGSNASQKSGGGNNSNNTSRPVSGSTGRSKKSSNDGGIAGGGYGSYGYGGITL